MVPPDHIDSNFRIAAEALVRQVPLPSENIHRMRGELPPDKAAREYEEEIRNCLPVVNDGFPSFDLMMVGMGDDGHIASMFPGSPALLERKRWVVASEHNQPPPPLVPRLTLTLPVINAAMQVMIMVSGEKKADRLRQVLEDEPGSQPLPAQLVNPHRGRLVFLLDGAAASRLKRL